MGGNKKIAKRKQTHVKVQRSDQLSYPGNRRLLPPCQLVHPFHSSFRRIGGKHTSCYRALNPPVAEALKHLCDHWIAEFASLFWRFCDINRNGKGNPKARSGRALLADPERADAEPPSVAGVLYSDKRTKISAETGALGAFIEIISGCLGCAARRRQGSTHGGRRE